MKPNDRRLAVSTTIFAAVTIVLVMVAAAGYGLYATNSATNVTETSISTTTETMAASSTAPVMQTLKSGGFLNSARSPSDTAKTTDAPLL